MWTSCPRPANEAGSDRMTERPDLETIRTTVEDILDAEAARSELIQDEIDDIDDDASRSFRRTRALLMVERELLSDLDEQLAAERVRIDDLDDASSYLQVEQAVRNRAQTLEKLHQHNEHLQDFHDALSTALDAVSANLDSLEASADPELEYDAEPHLQTARDALESHNEAVEGLGKHIRILTQYML